MPNLTVAVPDDTFAQLTALALAAGVELKVYAASLLTSHADRSPRVTFPQPRLTGRERQILEVVTAHAAKGVTRTEIAAGVGCAYATLQRGLVRLRALDGLQEDVGEPIMGRPCYVYRPGPRAAELLARERAGTLQDVRTFIAAHGEPKHDPAVLASIPREPSPYEGRDDSYPEEDET